MLNLISFASYRILPIIFSTNNFPLLINFLSLYKNSRYKGLNKREKDQIFIYTFRSSFLFQEKKNSTPKIKACFLKQYQTKVTTSLSANDIPPYRGKRENYLSIGHVRLARLPLNTVPIATFYFPSFLPSFLPLSPISSKPIIIKRRPFNLLLFPSFRQPGN